MNSRPLDGRRAIVTGAARGLGRAFAEASPRPARTSPSATSIRRSRSCRPCCEGHGVRAVAQVADVSEPADVARSSSAPCELGGLDLVVNNAGVVRATSPTTDPLDQAIEDFRWMVDVNLGGTYLVGRAAMPHLVAAGGDIVNVTTDHIHTCGYPVALDHADAADCAWATVPRPPLGGPGFDVYDASKWGVKGLTLTWSRALAPHGVRVNCFGMGATNTPMFRSHLGGRPSRRRRWSRSRSRPCSSSCWPRARRADRRQRRAVGRSPVRAAAGRARRQLAGNVKPR